MVYNDKGDWAGLRSYVQLIKHTQTHIHTHKSGSIHAHRTEGATGSERREGAYDVGGRIESGVEAETGTGSGAGTGT